MALTRDFKETVKARAERDPAFREALLTEAAEQLLAGDLETGKAMLRDFINATVGFEIARTRNRYSLQELDEDVGAEGQSPRAQSAQRCCQATARFSSSSCRCSGSIV